LTARPRRLPAGLAWACWGLALALPAAHAAPPSPATPETEPALARLIAAYEQVRTLSGSFTQETRFPGFPRPRTYAGTLDLVRPDRMRWDYTEGSGQQVYVNGRTVTVYVPEAAQAIESRLSPASDRQVPLHLLADVTRIPDTYTVAPGDGADALVLTPRDPDPAAPTSVSLWLSPETGLIDRVRLELPGGSRSDIAFRDVTTNRPVDPARFEFVAPEGVHQVDADRLVPAGAGR
jgi:outer membrane lipoprotein carrier protein